MNSFDDSLHRKTVRAALATRLLIVAALVLGSVVVFLQLQVTFRTNETAQRISEQQATNTSNVETIKSLSRQIESCTTPDGECAKRNQRASGSAIASINEFNLYAIACAQDPKVNTVGLLKACVERSLAAASERKTP